jgi:hypothetical protein
MAGAALTAIAIAYIFLRVDWGRIAVMDLSMDWLKFGAGVALIIGIYLVSSLRWMVLFQGELGYSASCLVVFIGHGLNAILPARGGDVVKLVYMQKTWGVPLGRGAIRLVLEKSLDLVAVVLVALVAWATLLNDRMSQLAVPLAAATVLILLLLAAGKFPAALVLLLNRLLARLPVSGQFAGRQESTLHEFSRLLRSRAVVLAAALTLVMWFFLQFVFVALIAASMHMQLDYPSALLIIACGALSIGLPSAPAGIGVYHAAVMGAFELLGFAPEQGLVAATLLHLLNTIPVLALGGTAYLVNHWRGAAPPARATAKSPATTPAEPPAISQRPQ